MNQMKQLKKLRSKDARVRSILAIWQKRRDDKDLPKMKPKHVLERIQNILEG